MLMILASSYPMKTWIPLFHRSKPKFHISTCLKTNKMTIRTVVFWSHGAVKKKVGNKTITTWYSTKKERKSKISFLIKKMRWEDHKKISAKISKVFQSKNHFIVCNTSK